MMQSIGTLIIDLKGITLLPEEAEILAHPLIGGVILFSRNFETKAQLKNLCKAIRLARNAPLIIMVDQEGGRVQRFKNEFTILPSLATFGKIYDQMPAFAMQLAKNCAWLMAKELLASGIDCSLTPVLDLDKGISTVIGDRAFHSQPLVVTTLANAFIEGMHEAGMAATGKHFPGHGAVEIDSHKAVCYDHRNFAEIAAMDLQPFQSLAGGALQAIMAAHIIFPEIDNLPVGYSKRWLTDILQKKLAFKGVILSDDLSMEGANISSTFVDRVILAKEAGCDFTLVCNKPQAVIDILDNLRSDAYSIPYEKWALLANNALQVDDNYEELPRWQAIHNILMEINGQTMRTSEKCIATLKDWE